MFLLCLLLAVPRRATTFSSNPHLFSVQCYDNWSVLTGFCWSLITGANAAAQRAVTQPGPTLLRSSQGQPPSLADRATLGLMAGLPAQDGLLQLGTASSACGLLVGNKCPGRGREGGATGTGHRGQARSCPWCLSVRPPGVGVLLGVTQELGGGPPSLHPDHCLLTHSKIQGGGWVSAGLLSVL